MVAERAEDASWGHVLSLLKTKNDSVRFAGLLLVTKCVSPDEHDKREEVFAAIGGVDFLLRLLLPLRRGRVHPQPRIDEDEVDRQIQLAGLGLSIVSNLCLCEAVAHAEGMSRIAEVAMGVMRYGPEALIRRYVRREGSGEGSGTIHGGDAGLALGLDVQCDMMRDACDCVHLIGGGVDPRAAISTINFVAGYDAWPSDGGRVETAQSTTSVEGGALPCLRSVLRCCLQVQESRDKVITEILERLLVADGGSEPSAPWLQRALEVLSFLDLAAERGMLDTLQDEAVLNIREGLRIILAARPLEVSRYEALRLSNAMASRSIDWLVEDVTFFELLTQTVRVEIGVLMLDAINLDATVSELRRLDIGEEGPGGQSEAGGTSQAGTTRLAKDRALMNLPVCFALFEILIEGLCDASDALDASSEEGNPPIGRIFEALTESAELMLQFVELNADDCTDVARGDIYYRDLLRVGCFRGFCSYASQNPLQFQDRLLHALEVNDFPIRLAVPALYGLAVVHERPITEISVISKLMDEAARAAHQGFPDAADTDDDPMPTSGSASQEVLLEVLLVALRRCTSTNQPDESVATRARTYPSEFGVERALATSSSGDEKVAAVAVTAQCFLLCREHEPLLRQLIQTCVPDLIDELFSAGDDDVQVSPLVQEMFAGLLSCCAASTDISRIELSGNTLFDLCTMFMSET